MFARSANDDNPLELINSNRFFDNTYQMENKAFDNSYLTTLKNYPKNKDRRRQFKVLC